MGSRRCTGSSCAGRSRQLRDSDADRRQAAGAIENDSQLPAFAAVFVNGNDTAMTTLQTPPPSLPFVELRDFNVLHWRGARAPGATAPEGDSGADTFLIDTCQRRVAVV